MKTYEIKDLLKKELLIIELPENGNTFDDLTLLNSETEGYTLLGKPNELKEEDARELFYNPIDSTNLTHYANLRNLFSLLESKIYWENPHQDVKGSVLDMTLGQWTNKKKFLEAQEKTFDKTRTLIFVKN